MLRLQELRNRSPWGGKAAVRFHLTRLLESPRAHSYPLSHQISRRTQSFGVQSLFWRIERRGAARRGAGAQGPWPKPASCIQQRCPEHPLDARGAELSDAQPLPWTNTLSSPARHAQSPRQPRGSGRPGDPVAEVAEVAEVTCAGGRSRDLTPGPR